MDSLHAIGTVVNLDERRFVVVGHRLVSDGASVGVGYVLVPYPLGFVDEESLAVVPASSLRKVVAEGFVDAAGTAHVAQLEELARATADIAPEEFAQNVTLLESLAREGCGNGEQA